ncbi:MAG: peptidoglycan binding domain-containing protein, partial [Lachnospiraceae bacterium]|nr:peptidoglycan binding domain-containing protein [Lachnospiraceae bacterium]
MEKKKRFWITIGCIAGAAAAGYFGTAVYFANHFPYHAAVDGIDVSGMTLEEAGQALAGRTSNYTLTLTGRGGLTDTITAEDIDLSMDMAQGELETLLRGRSPLRWPEALLRPVSYTSTAAAVCDEEKLTKRIDTLTFFDPQHITAPKDAEVALSGDRLTVVPEQEGTEPDREKVQEAIRIAVSYLTPSLNLDTAGLYREPQRRADDAALTAQADAENRILDEFPALRFGDQEERPGAEELLSWIEYENGAANIRQDKIAAYVSDLAEKYDTVGKKRSFTDPGSHRTVTVEPGTFGWELDQEATAEELTAAIAADGMKNTAFDASDGGEATAAGTDAVISVDTEQRIGSSTGIGSGEGSFPVLDPVWKQEGKEHGDQDWGRDYVAVDLDNQHVYVVQNDKVVLDSDCVSGKAVVGHSTPDGIFYIFAMAKDAVLKGDGYASPVKNWMPFYRGVGFHDATWRSRFGGKIYITSGSHGCVNLPLSFATKLYDLVEVGTPVLVYGGMSQEDA